MEGKKGSQTGKRKPQRKNECVKQGWTNKRKKTREAFVCKNVTLSSARGKPAKLCLPKEGILVENEKRVLARGLWAGGKGEQPETRWNDKKSRVVTQKMEVVRSGQGGSARKTGRAEKPGDRGAMARRTQ